jgi:lysine-specific permease
MSPLEKILWSAGFLLVLFLLNYFSVGAYGESEFWFAGIKVLTIVVFLVVGILMIFGVMSGPSPGFANWTIGDAPFPGGFAAIISIFMIAGFSFQGTELIGVAAGEVEHPEKSIPKAIKTVFVRIMLFYIGGILVISFLLPYNDPNLLHTGIENVSVSPFTLIFHRAGIGFAAALMNAVILTSVLSCANSGMYASTRMLYSLAMEGKAPGVFKTVNKKGVPLPALFLTTLIGMAAFLGSMVGEGTVYLWLVNASGVAGFIAWLGIAISHYKFRKAFLAQGHSLNELKYKAMFFPFGPCLAMVLCLIVIFGQLYANADYSVLGFFVAYIGAVLFIAIFLIYKVVKRTKGVRPEEADLSQGFAVKH